MSVVTGPSLLQIQKVSFVFYSISYTAVQKKEKEKNNLFTTATLTAKIGQSCKNRYEYEFEFAVQSLQCCPRCCLDNESNLRSDSQLSFFTCVRFR